MMPKAIGLSGGTLKIIQGCWCSWCLQNGDYGILEYNDGLSRDRCPLDCSTARGLRCFISMQPILPRGSHRKLGASRFRCFAPWLQPGL